MAGRVVNEKNVTAKQAALPLPRKVVPADPGSIRETPAVSTQEVLKQLRTFRACCQTHEAPRNAIARRHT